MWTVSVTKITLHIQLSYISTPSNTNSHVFDRKRLTANEEEDIDEALEDSINLAVRLLLMVYVYSRTIFSSFSALREPGEMNKPPISNPRRE
jgi:hypothetical protein